MEEIEENIPEQIGPNDLYDPNHTLIATLSSTTDTDQFCNAYNHDNGYKGLKLGQKINIQTSLYDSSWLIAGFDMEYNHAASDGTIKNNGYGISLIPENTIYSTSWNPGMGVEGTNTPYKDSNVHTVCNNYIYTRLVNILGSHLVNRNVLLGNRISTVITGQGHSSYTWTTAYLTLMSGCQLTGEVAKYKNKYDDGEANYKLPIFDHMNYWLMEDDYWIRCGDLYDSLHISYEALRVMNWNDIKKYNNDIISDTGQWSSIGVRPMIYIR